MCSKAFILRWIRHQVENGKYEQSNAMEATKKCARESANILPENIKTQKHNRNNCFCSKNSRMQWQSNRKKIVICATKTAQQIAHFLPTNHADWRIRSVFSQTRLASTPIENALDFQRITAFFPNITMIHFSVRDCAYRAIFSRSSVPSHAMVCLVISARLRGVAYQRQLHCPLRFFLRSFASLFFLLHRFEFILYTNN